MTSQPSGSEPNGMDLDSVGRYNTSFVQLPEVVVEKIVKSMSFDDMSRLRQVCKMLKAHSERLLNEGFVRLGRQLTNSTAELKKKLPKKESERRAHPLNRYSEVFSALETRYTLLSMTYKKYIDLRLCCFIPGKVLDLAFGVMIQIRLNLSKHSPGQNIAPIDVISVLRDIRDYSSMAMEHFDENVVPRYPNKPLSFHAFRQIAPGAPINLPQGSLGLISQCCGTKFVNAQSDESTDDETDFTSQIEDLRKEMRDGFEEKDRVIDEQRKELSQQRRFISSIVALLEEVGKRDEWNQGFMAELDQISTNCRGPATKKIMKKRTSHVASKDDSVIVISSGSSSVSSDNEESKKAPNYIISDSKTIDRTTKEDVPCGQEPCQTKRYSFRKRNANGLVNSLSIDQPRYKKRKNAKIDEISK